MPSYQLLWFLGTLALIQVAYVWFITAGTFTRWPVMGIYYDWLADAFRAGQLHVLVPAHPELLLKEDPYDKVNGRYWLVDLSLWKGKYYLYWGPVPAAIQAAVKALFQINKTIGDQYLAFGFISLAGVAGPTLVYRMATRLGQSLRWFVIIPAMLTVAFVNPILHLLTTANVYIVAIAGGQAFLILGLLLAFEAILSENQKQRQTALLLGASVSYGLSMGCRASLAPACILAAALSALILARLRSPGWFRRLCKYGTLAGGPAALAGALLLFYNWVRFDRFFEFGTNIQTGYFKFTFDAKHLLPNLYTYNLREVALSCHFPYFFQEWFPKASEFPSWLERPKDYLLNEPVAGLLLVVPILYWLPFSVLGTVKHFFQGHTINRAYLFALLSFIVCSTISGIVPLGLYMATMRYQADIIYGATLLSLLGWFNILWRMRGGWSLLISCAGVLTCLGTIIFGLALGYQGYNGHVHHSNPQLDKALRRTFSICPADTPKFPRFAPNGNTNEDRPPAPPKASKVR